MKPYLSIIIPVYNERDNFLAGRLEDTFSYLKRQTFSWELIFVDDGSTDDSKKLLDQLVKKDKRIRLVSIEHGGKMKAVSNGAKAANGEILLFADFDQSTPIHFLDNFLERHKEGADIVIGIRGKGPDRMKVDSWYRKLRSKSFLYLAKLVISSNIEDYFCGFKSFTMSASEAVFRNLKATKIEKMQGAYMGAWDVEALFVAQKLKFKIAQEPVDWYKIKSLRLNVIKEPLLIISELLKIRLLDIRGEYSNLLKDEKALLSKKTPNNRNF